MRTLSAATMLLVLFAVPVAAAEKLSPEDAYIACAVGRGAVEINNGKAILDAQDAAFEACAALVPKTNDTDQIEALDDFIGELIDRLAPASADAPTTETTHL
jgi:hypothetical protein